MMYKKQMCYLLSLFFGTFFAMISGFLARVFLARFSSIETFGNYSSVFTVITTFAPLCGFGVAQWWLKISGQYGISGFSYIKKSLKFVVFSTLVIFVFSCLWFLLSLQGSLLVMSLFNTVISELVASTLQLQNRYFVLSIWQFMQSSTILIIAILFWLFCNTNFTEINIGAFYLINSMIFCSAGFFIIKKYFSTQTSLCLRNNIAVYGVEKYQTLEIIKEVIPFGIAGLFYLIYYQLGIVFVRYFEGAEAASYYTVAFSFLSVAIAVPGVLYQKFLLPKLHRWAYHDREKFLQSYKYGNYLMIILGVICGLGLWFLAPYFIKWFFGERYLPAIHLVQLMALNIPIVYLASSAGSLLVTRNHMKIKVVYMGISAGISLILNPILIIKFGTDGAIYTNIVCNIFIMFLYFWAVKYRVLNKHGK